jgi:hypothetical protein
MELVLTTEDLQSLPKQQEDLIIEPSGFLNSEYKSVVNENLNNISAKSIFGIKQRIKSSQYQFTSSIETVLKVSVFTIIIMNIFS